MGRLLKESDVRARLRRGAEGVLTHAVDSRELGSDGHAAVHRSLRSLCRAARTNGVQVEQLVVICKDAWRTLPAAHRLPPETGRLVIRGVIAQCIEEFYRTDDRIAERLGTSESTALAPSSLSFMLGPLS
jgi:hypothetical protein